MSFHWMRTAAEVRFAEPHIATLRDTPVQENKKIFECIVPWVPRQVAWQVRTPLRSAYGRFALPLRSAARSRLNEGLCFDFPRAITKRTDTPRLCARISASVAGPLKKLQVAMWIVDPLWAWLMAPRMCRWIVDFCA